MATEHPTQLASQWDAALVDLHAAQTATSAIEKHASGSVKDQILSLLDRAADTVFQTPAPSLGAVARKLEIYWGERLFRDDIYWNEYRQKIVGDIRRIERLQAGVGEPHATGGLDVTEASEMWDQAAREYDRLARDLQAEPNETRRQIAVRKEKAEQELLTLPALTLDQVIKKLEILWSDLGFDPVEDETAPRMILEDLHRFSLVVSKLCEARR